MAITPSAESEEDFHQHVTVWHHMLVTQREEDRRLRATSKETQNSSDKCSVRGMWEDVGDSTSQEELCLDMEVVGREVSAQ